MPESPLEPLITECPSCHTRFRVTEAQLGKAGGRVRCGACLTVFLATESLDFGAASSRKRGPTAAELDELLDELGRDRRVAERATSGSEPSPATAPGAQRRSHTTSDDGPAPRLPPRRLRPVPAQSQSDASALGASARIEGPGRDTLPASAPRANERTLAGADEVVTNRESAARERDPVPRADATRRRDRSERPLPASTATPAGPVSLPSDQLGAVGDEIDSGPGGEPEDRDTPERSAAVAPAGTAVLPPEIPSPAESAAVVDFTVETIELAPPPAEIEEASSSDASATGFEDRRDAGADRVDEIATVTAPTTPPLTPPVRNRRRRRRDGSVITAAIGDALPAPPPPRESVSIPLSLEGRGDFEEPPRRRRWWLPLALLVAAGALAAQVLYFQFDEWSRDLRYRPLYEWLCPHVGCRLPDMSALEAIRSRNLVVRSHPDVPGALVVDAIVVNEAPFPQPFPLIELRFSSLTGSLVAGRRFSPAEYLSGELRGAHLMQPRTPVHIALEIEDPGAEAVNYVMVFRTP